MRRSAHLNPRPAIEQSHRVHRHILPTNVLDKLNMPRSSVQTYSHYYQVKMILSIKISDVMEPFCSIVSETEAISLGRRWG